MSTGSILLIVGVLVLVVVWLLLTHKAPPIRARNAADYRHQQSENPDYSTPSGGGQGSI